MNFLEEKRSFYWERWGRRRKDWGEEINSDYYGDWESQNQCAQKEVTADQFDGENKLRAENHLGELKHGRSGCPPLPLLPWTVISYQQNNSRISGTQ